LRRGFRDECDRDPLPAGTSDATGLDITRRNEMESAYSAPAGAPFRLSWPAVFGGLVSALGVWLLLHALGMAIGLTQVDLRQANLTRALGMSVGIWSIVATFLAMTVGGLATARSAGYLGRGNGALLGLVLWGSTGVLSTFLLGSAIGSMASQAAETGSKAASLALEQASVSTSQVLPVVNQTLEKAGKPPLTAEQLQAAARDALTTSALEGRLDRQVFFSALADNTQLTESDVEQLFAGSVRQAESRLQKARRQVEAAAQTAATATGRAFWGLFALLTTGLAGAMLGTLTGVSRGQRELLSEPSPPGPAYREQRHVYP
jgi:hypothetical protein